MKLKMVAGKTYTCPPIFGNERVIVRGEVVEVPDDKAQILLDDQYTDALNNPHPYFVKVQGSADGEDSGEGSGEGDGEEGAPPAAKPAAKSARRR